eukprot:gnl/TRDRNA2_/TRDRNA2_197739_c0_seq1.p1 gnl/TRDRNA2_/TRDRNA2_197739_c0~~gnl/TRDRNA2_/TRDRNA2_197739_c0_seq1.p1  ORF type:complete len:202 (-),score=40.30 gnl/TRDRNA2_/TRDRNA2_197739_c0_seq1:24-629(-)
MPTDGYSAAFLEEQGQAKPETWGLPKDMSRVLNIAKRIKDVQQRGFCRQLLAYLAETAKGPGGIQRPPLDSGVTCIRMEKPEGTNNPQQDRLFDDAIPFLLLFLATNAKSQVVVSLDPFVSFPAAMMLQQAGLKIVREARPAFEQVKSSYWNLVVLPADKLEGDSRPSAADFVSKHLRSGQDASGNDDKWLRFGAFPTAKL